LLTRLGRFILSKIGIVPQALAVAVREQLAGATGNTSAIPLKALKSTIEFLEEEILEIKGVEVRFPLDVEGAEYVFFPPVSDFLIEADTLMGIACVLNEAGVSWTIASGNYDAINYGLFYSDEVLEKVLQKMADEVIRIKGKKILIGECGHASRSAKAFLPSFNRYEEIPVVNILELTARLIDEGRVQIDTTAVTEKVTYHDPCNIARSGWVVDQPRNIIRSFIKDFVEMTPSGRYNLCCGGGGGTVSINELKPYRMDPAGRKKAEQLKATGADVVITPCANCKKQISELIAHYKLPMRHAGLHDLIFTAIKMKNQVKTDE
jgi:Fe-S oxidoreductase